MNEFKLNQLDVGLRWFLAIFLFVLAMGVTVGLVYVSTTTDINPQGTVEHYAGSKVDDDFDIPEKYPKSVDAMLLTTHTHIIAFALIFVLLGGLFYYNSIISATWKNVLMIEPLLATLVTFGSIWGIRFIHPAFSYLTILSGSLMYLSFYTMTTILLYDLIFKK
ncbi:MAG TPA: hypothetical protein EYO79_03625 [Candidatus Marinimicrobia bacterium]|nr:hypothetical protein [Candidatus Neomarinimicrobiota bacterium]